MPGTSARGYHYPVAGDEMGDLPSTLLDLVNDIEAKLKRFESGNVSQVCTANTNHNVVVTFATPFAAAPVVVASVSGSDADAVHVLVGAITTTQVTFIVKSVVGATRTIRWIAHG